MSTMDDDMTLSITSSSDLFSNVLGALILIVIATQGFIIILLVPLAFVYGYLYKRFSMTNTNLTQLEAATRSPIFVQFSQTMLGLQSIRVYRCQESFSATLDDLVHCNVAAAVAQATAAQWVSLRLSVLGAIITFAVGAIGVGFHNKGLLDASYLAMALSYSIKLTNLLKAAVRIGALTESQFNAVQRIDEYCQLPCDDSIEDDLRGIELSSAIVGMSPVNACENHNESIEVQPAIAFDQVFMKYKYGPVALKDINFSVKEGERIGIVGRTG